MRKLLFVPLLTLTILLTSCPGPNKPDNSIRIVDWRIDFFQNNFEKELFTFHSGTIAHENDNVVGTGEYIDLVIEYDYYKDLVIFDQNYYPSPYTYRNDPEVHNPIFVVHFENGNGTPLGGYYPDDAQIRMSGTIDNTTFDISYTDIYGKKQHFHVSAPVKYYQRFER